VIDGRSVSEMFSGSLGLDGHSPATVTQSK